MNAIKYVDPKADLTFKKIFGEHPDLIISLLNALLPLPEEGRIESIEYLPPEILPDDPLHKNSIVDVRCKDQLGRQFLVEMQMIWTPDFKQRALFNAAKAYSRELPRGGDYGSLKPVYSLNLLNENLDLDSPKWYHQYRLAHTEIKNENLDDIQIVFVELKKFTPQTWEERKMAVLWLRFLTEIDETTRYAPAELEENPVVKKALVMAEVAAMTPEERALYDGFQDWLCRERRKANAEKKLIHMAEIEAKLETTKEEFNAANAQLDATNAQLDATNAQLDATSAQLDAANAQLDATNAQLDAAREQLRQNAGRMKADGLPVETIVKYTGLTADEIASL